MFLPMIAIVTLYFLFVFVPAISGDKPQAVVLLAVFGTVVVAGGSGGLTIWLQSRRA
jgi:hypothetical protein